MSGYYFPKNIVFCLKIFFTFINGVDPDEMQHYAAFHLRLHCLQKYLFRVFSEYKGVIKSHWNYNTVKSMEPK